MASSSRLQVLVIAGPLSSYTWRLFDTIRSRHRIDIRVIHLPIPQAGGQFGHEPQAPVGENQRCWSLGTAPGVLGFMDAHNAEAVLILGTENRLPLLYALARIRRDVPVVFSSDANLSSILPAGLRDWTRLAAYRALSAFVTEGWVLGRSADDALRLLGIKRRRTLPIYAVDFAELGAPRAKAHNPSAVLSLLTIARLSPQKNLLRLVDAVTRDGIQSRVRLVIIGEGPERAPIERLLAERRARNVSLLGAVPHAGLHPEFSRASALVLPSIEEPWGIAIVEALGLGLPVLATPAVGAATSLAGRFHGLLISDGPDIDSLRAAIEGLMEHYLTLAEAAVCEAARLRAEFSIESVADQVSGRLFELAH